jgi:HSP20 family protein
MLSRSATVLEPDRLTARVFDSATRGAGCRLETYREGDTFHIDIDLPGVDPADIDVSVEGTVLTIRAERRRDQHEALRRAGRPAGSCTRQVDLSDALDTDRTEASYDHGVLTLRIPVTGPATRREPVPAELAPAA